MTQPANSNYTPDEIQAVVQKLVLSTISHPVDTLGVRRTDLTFNDVQQAAAGVFILYPNAPFYVLKLGLSRVQDLITAEASVFDQLLAAVGALGRKVLPVTDVSPLFNVHASLQALATAATARAGAINVTKAPAYQQFTTNTAAFLKGPAGQAVKSGGNIVAPPPQAQAAVPSLMTQLQQQHTKLVATVQGIVNGIKDYNALSLPSIVIQSVLSNAAALIGADATLLNGLSPTQRLTYVRQAVLNLLAAQAAVASFGTFTGPSDFYTLSGTGMPFSDANHAAVPASVTTDYGARYAVLAGVSDDLNVTADGGAPFDIILYPSTIATLNGLGPEPFIIGDGTHPVPASGYTTPNNNVVKIKVEADGPSSGTYVTTLAVTGDATAAIVTGTVDINTGTLYGAPTASTTTGSTNISAGSLYGAGHTLDGTVLSLNVDGAGFTHLTFVGTGNAANETAMLAAIVAQWPTLTAVDTGGGGHNLKLTGTVGGTIVVDATGTSTANTALGLTPGTYAGTGGLDGKTLIINPNGEGAQTLTLNGTTNAASDTALLAAINALWSALTATMNGSQYLVLTDNTLGTTSSLVVGAGTANTKLGLTPGTTTGTKPTTSTPTVVSALNAVLPANVRAQPYYSPRKFSGLMDIPAGTNTQWTLTLAGSADFSSTGLNIQVTDTVTVLSGANAGVWPITAVTLVGGSWTITVQGATSVQASANVEIGPANRFIRIVCTDPPTQVPLETKLTIYGDDTPSTNALSTFGFSNGEYSQCLMNTPDAVAKDINGKTGTLTAGTVFSPLSTLSTARADVLNPNLVVFTTAAALGDAVFAGPALTYTVTSVGVAGNISTGDTIALRGGPSAGNGLVITTVNGGPATDHPVAVGDVIVASGYAGSSSTNVNVEFGPTLTVAKYNTVVVSGGPSAGSYVVASQGSTAIDVLLTHTLPQRNATTSPTTANLILTAAFGVTYLTLTSKNTTTASKLIVQGNAAASFFASVPSTTVGTTPWFQLPSIPNGLQAGDVLELYGTDYNVPSHAYNILAVISSLKVIQLDQDLVASGYVTDGVTWQFGTQPPPFARLHYGTLNDFSQVQALLNTWLALPENQPSYFANLNGLINPLLVGTNPTAEQVGAATTALTQLYQFLTTAEAAAQNISVLQCLEGILPTFTIEAVPAVDGLIKSYIAKGSDRAVDILLSGQFSTFFGLTVDGASYAGSMQEATRAVAQNDLAVSKNSRSTAYNSRLQSQATSPDFEYPSNSVNETLQGEVAAPTPAGTPTNYGRITGSSGAGGNG